MRQQLGVRAVAPRLKAGQITFNGGRSTIECTIRGLSKSGAMIQVISTAGVPERFKLGVVSEELHRMCKIAHKRDNQIEVVFVNAPAPPFSLAENDSLGSNRAAFNISPGNHNA